MTLTLTPIAEHELRSNTWYYGVHCACTRHLPLQEDCLAGNGLDLLPLPEGYDVKCDCGAIFAPKWLKKFKRR
jgi:hypothetical protein